MTKKIVMLLLCFCFIAAVMYAGGQREAAEAEEGAATYPNRPIELIVPFGVGGATDISVRLIQPYLQEALGVPIVVRNVGGAGGRIGATEAYAAKPDGYTIFAHNLPSVVVGQLLYDPAYDIVEASAIAGWTSAPRVVAVHPNSPYNTFEELRQASLEKRLVFSGLGYGSVGHLQAVQLKENAGMEFEYVPYPSGGEAILALLGQQVDFSGPAAVSAKSFYDDGEIKVLAIQGSSRVDMFPDIPTIVELGHSDTVSETNTGLFGPPGMDPEIVNILAQALETAVNHPKYKEDAIRTEEPVQFRAGKVWEDEVLYNFDFVGKILPALKADLD